MSLDALPTELDEQLLGLLDRKGLSAISKTSKYYRQVAEPLLYRHICLSIDQPMRVRWLMVTLLSRPDLATYIKTLELSGKNVLSQHPTDRYKALELSDIVEQSLPAIHNAIRNGMGQTRNSADQRIQWLGAILGEDYLEGSFTLIVCLAMEVESITLITAEDYGYLLSHVMSRLHWESYGKKPLGLSSATQERMPKVPFFSKTRHLRFETQSVVYVPILPFLESLILQGCGGTDSSRLGTWSTVYGTPKLHTLEFIDTVGSSGFICDIFESSQAPNLKRLVVRQVSYAAGCNYQYIIDTLLEHCPNLEYLEIGFKEIEEDERDGIKPLQNIHKINSLRILRIDLDFLVRRNNRLALFHLDGIHTPQLTELHLTNVDAEELAELADPYLIQGDLEDNEALTNRLQGAASTSTIKNLTLTADFPYFTEENAGDDFYRPTKFFLSWVATTLHTNSSTSFKVFRPADQGEDEPKLLVDHEGTYE